jgi:uncharacterized protein (DUF1786 family)
MSRFLLVDIGAGTMDILYYDTETGLPYKAVVESPVRTVAKKVAGLSGDLVVTGVEMGGGPITDILRKKANKNKIIMSESAAATLHHNPKTVQNWGIEIIMNTEAQEMARGSKFTHINIGDLEAERIERIVAGFGVEFEFDVVGLCAQDHGAAPEHVSHLDYRHNMFTDILDRVPHPETLLYQSRQVPPTMNRLTSLAKTAEKLPAKEVYVMDSGIAAILGASLDAQTQGKKKILVLDIATSHTVAAAMDANELVGFFEYHTRDITLNRLETLLFDLTEGNLSHKQILAEGGHGAYIRRAIGFDSCEIIVATGPKRKMLKDSKLPIAFGAPWGDNMMTGTVGLLEAIIRKKGLPEISYL